MKYKFIWWHLIMLPISLFIACILSAYHFLLKSKCSNSDDRALKIGYYGKFIKARSGPPLDDGLLSALYGNWEDGQSASPAPELNKPVLRPFDWWIRNPLHNYMWHVLGLVSKDHIELITVNGVPQKYEAPPAEYEIHALFRVGYTSYIISGVKTKNGYYGLRRGGAFGVALRLR